MGRPKTDLATAQVAIRLPLAWIARADALAKRLSQPGIAVSRSEALRAVMIRGLEAMEAEGATPKTPRPPTKGRARPR